MKFFICIAGVTQSLAHNKKVKNFLNCQSQACGTNRGLKTSQLAAQERASGPLYTTIDLGIRSFFLFSFVNKFKSTDNQDQDFIVLK